MKNAGVRLLAEARSLTTGESRGGDDAYSRRGDKRRRTLLVICSEFETLDPSTFS